MSEETAVIDNQQVKKTIGIAEYEEKIKNLTQQSVLTPGDERLINLVSHWVRELFGEGFSGKTFENYTVHELSNLRGVFANLAGSLSELEGRLLEEVKKQEVRNESKEAELEEEAKLHLTTTHNKDGFTIKKPPTVQMVNAYTAKKIKAYKYTFIFKEGFYLKVRNLRYSLGRNDQAIDSRIKVLLSEKLSGAKTFLDNSVELPDDVDLDLNFQPAKEQQETNLDSN